MFVLDQADVINIDSQNIVFLQPNGVIINFFHSCYHAGRQRLGVPVEVRTFINAHYKSSAQEMFKEIIAAVSRRELNINISSITEDNIRYWWSAVRRERVETDTASAVARDLAT